MDIRKDVDSNLSSEIFSKKQYIILEYVSNSTVQGYHPMTGSLDDVVVPIKKPKLCPSIRPELMEENSVASLKQAWSESEGKVPEGVKIIKNPFKLCIVEKLLENMEFVNHIKEDFNEITWNKTSTDLYEFFQSKDLKSCDLEYIKAFYDFMKRIVMPWVAEITGFDLVDVSASCSCYTSTDFLLPHDDQMEDRRVAFVYYLVGSDGWNNKKGGTLDLFSKNENGLPSKIQKSILPKNNQLVFFPVANDSYHQVAEVTTLGSARLSINGWFHVKTKPVFEIPEFKYPQTGLFGNPIIKLHADCELESWINSTYLANEMGNRDKIQKQIEETSEISLKNFLTPEALEVVYTSLQQLDLDAAMWSIAAPPNRSCYEVLTHTALPSKFEKFINLLKSEFFFSYLKSITDLDLKTVRYEFQRWTAGNYCLLWDHDWNNINELDLIIYFPIGEAGDIIGGKVVYVNAETEVQGALISIDPSINTLNLVYRDTARYTSYFSKQSKCDKFFLLMCSYAE